MIMRNTSHHGKNVFCLHHGVANVRSLRSLYMNLETNNLSQLYA